MILRVYCFSLCCTIGRPNGGRCPPTNLGFPTFPQRRQNRLDAETASKLEQIMTRNGIITMDNEEHKTEIKDLEDLGELGNGTSGHVVKMKHNITNKVIAVKVFINSQLPSYDIII